MAKFNVLSINKMTAGERRGLLDMTIELDYEIANALLLDVISANNNIIAEDTALSTEDGNPQQIRTQYISDYKPTNAKNPLATEELSNSLLLQEYQDIELSTISHNVPQCIQLMSEEQINIMHDQNEAKLFNGSTMQAHVIYEYEKIANDNTKTLLQQDDGLKAVLLPLNDLLDLCIKSQFKKNALNYNVPGDLVPTQQPEKANWNIDMYIDFKQYPVDFCQCANGGFILTQPTTLQPYMLHAKFTSTNDIKELHSFQLEQKQIKTKLYVQPKAITKGTTTYKDALSAHEQWYNTPEHAAELFDLSSTNVLGMSYSYVIGIDQEYGQNGTDNPTIYGNGDIYGSMSMTKSMYDSLYSMKMVNESYLSGCRTYCGIQNSQNKVLLKYYDDTRYTFVRKIGDTQATAHYIMHPDGDRWYPYQKVEFFLPNRVAADAKHKSNLFSIKVWNSGLDDDSLSQLDDSKKHIAQQIKRDLFNGMKQLVDSIAPANTQLFKAYYMKGE